jgi:hypothetical protein
MGPPWRLDGPSEPQASDAPLARGKSRATASCQTKAAARREAKTAAGHQTQATTRCKAKAQACRETETTAGRETQAAAFYEASTTAG